jgi:hypothetical protein
MPDTELSSEPARPRTPLLRNWLSLAGLVIAVGTLFSFLLLCILDAAAHLANPYLGIPTYLVAPGFLITGSFLIILGALWQRHRLKAAASLPSCRHRLNRMSPGKLLRLIVAADATVAWSADNWATTSRVDTAHNSALNVWFADLSMKGCPGGAVIEFTFLWKEAKRSEGRNYSVKGSEPK